MLFSANLVRAIVWMLGAILSFTVMLVSVRELADTMHAFEMLFMRSAIGVAILAAVLSLRGWHRAKTTRIWGHSLRNVVHFAGQTFWIYGIALLPLAMVSAIEFTTPLWGAFLSVLFLGERMNRGRWAALVLGFIGILVILQPGLAAISLGAIIMLGCTFCFGATNAITKSLTRTDSVLAIVFYMVAMQTLLGAVATAFVWVPIAPGDWPWLFLLAITGLSAHFCVTSALTVADATIVLPMDFLRLPIVALVGFLVYAEAFVPATLIGAALIFAGNYYCLRYESRLARQG